MLAQEDRWDLMKAFFYEKGLVRQHLDSFNDFIGRSIQQIVDEVEKIEPDIPGFYVKLGKVEVGEPTIREADGAVRPITPMEARIRNLTYYAPLWLEMTSIDINEGVEIPGETINVYIGRLPVMLKSNKCLLAQMSELELVDIGEDPSDPGGYFIINGSERVLVTQEDLAPNKILIEESSRGKTNTHIAKVFSTARGFRAPVTVERRKDGSLRVSFPSVPRKVPLANVLRALGLETDKQIVDAISNRPEVIRELIPTVREAADIKTIDDALDYIGKRVAVGQMREYRIKRAKQVLDKYLLPHVGTTEGDRKKKAYFLSQMAQRILELFLGIRNADDKDHYANKRLKLAGDLLTSLFRVAFLNLVRDITYQLERTAVRGKKPNIKTAVRADVITERLRHALATGNWVGGKAGVSQLLDRTNYMSTLSHLRRVVSPLSRSQPHFEARDLHPTHWGKICVAPDTQVLLGDHVFQTRIDDMEEDFDIFSVTTIDENTYEEIPSQIIAYQRVSAHELGKRVLEIKTITGRTIQATEDHPFLTNRGWVEAGDLKLSDKVIIRPTLDPSAVIDHEERIVFTILDSDNFLNGIWRNALPEEEQHYVENDFEELSELGLLPLDSDHPKLPILARLLGAILTDGSITNTVEFYLGTENDAVRIHRDLESLGFIANPITKKEGIFQQDESQEPVHYHTYLTTKGGAFKRLMMALGAPIGRRSEQKSIFPDWISNCPKKIKREFLGAFMGGDGSAPWVYKRTNRKDSYKVRLPEIEIHKHPDYVDSQIVFFESLKQLFAEFGIDVNTIKTKQISRENRIAVDLIFDASKDNILRLCRNVGYRYCQDKQNKAQLIGEFLAYRREEIKRRIQNKKKAIELYEQGLPQRQIAEQLGIGYRVVTSIIQRRFQKRETVHPKSSWSAGRFLDETEANLETGMLRVPLASIKRTDEDIVCDFTTALHTHSFIGNGFVTHNCPNETPEGPNCVLPNTLVTLPGGSTRTIGSFLINDDWNRQQVVSIDWNPDGSGNKHAKNCNITRFIRNPMKESTPLYRIMTKMGKEVYATGDHPFYYKSGIGDICRIDAKDLKIGHKVAVLPASTQRPDWSSVIQNFSEEVVISEDTFVENLPPHSRTWKAAVNKAKELGLLPLRYDSPALPILIRLASFAVGDGHLSLRERKGRSGKPKSSVTVIFSGKPEEMEEIRKDLNQLGFTASRFNEIKTTSELEDGRIISGTSCQIRLDDRIFWTLLRALGSVVGDKAKNIPSIPKWIMECTSTPEKLPIIREYLAGLFGSEMSTPSVNKRDGKTFLAPTFSINVVDTEENRKKAKSFLGQVSSLCKLFDVETAPKAIVTRKGTIRKSGKKTRKYRLKFSSDIHNLVNLYSRIGFAYEQNREQLAQYTVAYLTEKIRKINFRKKSAEITWTNRDKPFEEIWETLVKELPRIAVENPLVTKHDIKNWARNEDFDSNKIRIQAKNFPTFEEWIAKNAVKPDSNIGLVWDEVTEIELADLENIPFDSVDDFTINDDSHNFFANGFLTGNCGLVKNLALMAYISVGVDEDIVEEILTTYGVRSLDELEEKEANQSRVFLNGRLVGYHPNPSAFVDQIKKARRANEIDDSVNLAYYHETDEVKINCDPGRVRRPLTIVENGKPKITPKNVEKLRNGELKWDDLILNGLIEYLDAEDEENAYIAIDPEELTPSHTHLEIAISTILGICASIIPFPQHNQSPRNTYEAGMSKQALGLYAKNFQLRVDTRGHFLHYPQIPLVKTRAMDVIDFDKCPAGQNFVVAILSHGGYNMEDALIINKASLERGLARSTFFRCYDVEEKRYPGGQEDRFEIPSRNVRGYRVSEAYRHLAEDGLIEPETDVMGGDVIIGRTSPPRFLEEYTEFEMPAPIRRETSISLRHGERGIIDSVIVTETVDGNRLVKVKVRDQRVPELGDKFASRHGQKGVLGIIVPQEDMPFTEDGVVPDLIINPHAIPSRMTVGQIIEAISSKVGCIEGKRKDGTAFSGSEETLHEEMRAAGFDHRGLESMYNGMTGEKLGVDIFIGLVYYQRLHHMVADKLHARARGPVQILTRQPTEGRAREGGLRFGEMERDCLIGHGAALLLKERLLDESDKTMIIVCDECGLLAVQDRSRDRYYCPICGDKTTVSRVTMSYAFKLLLQELMSLGISPRLRLKEPA